MRKIINMILHVTRSVEFKKQYDHIDSTEEPWQPSMLWNSGIIHIPRAILVLLRKIPPKDNTVTFGEG